MIASWEYGGIFVVDIESQEIIRKFGENTYVQSLLMCNASNIMASLSDNEREIIIWDAKSEIIVQKFGADFDRNGAITTMDFCHDGRFLAIGSQSGTIKYILDSTATTLFLQNLRRPRVETQCY